MPPSAGRIEVKAYGQLAMKTRTVSNLAWATLGMLAVVNAHAVAVNAVFAAVAAPSLSSQAEHPNLLDSREIDARVAALLRQMTLAEKAGQLTQFSNGDATGPDNIRIDQNKLAARGGIGAMLNVSGAKACNKLQRQAVERSRLKIPILFGMDVIHGHRTVYPIPLGLSAAWDTALAERCARMAAVEATADGIRWTFSPMVDIARDAHWGRIAEGSGEDPCLGSAMAAAWVRGYQGKKLSDSTSMVACAKHFVAYGGAEGGRDYNTVNISQRTLRDIYLPPFKAALDAGAGTFMSAFNSLQGVPASANRQTLTDILRTEWGFRGFVVSDWDSIGELVQHGVALDGREAALKAITAGVDMDMQSKLYDTKLPELVGHHVPMVGGGLKIEVVDQAVSRVLRVKFALGLFERPYVDEKSSTSRMLTAEHLELARQAAEESFVLLKNDPREGKPVLPLEVDRTVALIGPLADSREGMFGPWVMKGDPSDAISLRHSLAERIKDRLVYAKGVDTRDESEAGFGEALARGRQGRRRAHGPGRGPRHERRGGIAHQIGPPRQATQTVAGGGRHGQAGSADPVQRPASGDSVGSRARSRNSGSLVSRRAGRTGPRADIVW